MSARSTGRYAGLAVWLLMSLLHPVCAQQPPTSGLAAELQRFLYDDASATLHFRSFLFDRENARPPAFAAAVVGGWVELKTGWLFDTLQLGAVGYTSQPLWAPQSAAVTSDGTSLLKPGGYGFVDLGQAYASVRWKGQTATIFRQYIDELEVNPRDDRELPQTFEAYALRGKLNSVNYFAGYVAAIKPRDYSTFINMGEAAGAPNYNAGMGLFSVKYGTMEELQLRASTYYVPNVLWSSYGDAGGTIPINEQLKFMLAGQFAAQGSNGANLITGQSFSTFWGGFRADAVWGPFDFRLSYQQVGSAAAWRSPYGIYIGYNKVQVLDFNRAGETSVTAGFTYNLIAMGLPGVAVLASSTYGGNAVNPATGAALADAWEHNLELALNGADMDVPVWLKPFRLRNRVAFVDQYLGNTRTTFPEYRIQLNYEVTWKGPGRR